MRNLEIAVDTGGTFTDCVVRDCASGQITGFKVLSTPHDPSVAIFNALQGEDDEEGGPIVAATPWLLVLLPAALVLSFDYLGVLTALVLLVFLGQAIFSLRSPLRSLLIAIAVVAPTYAVFKYVLYARFPAGILGIG